MTWFTLVLILRMGSGTASVTLPHYTKVEKCVAAGRVAEQERGGNITGWVCVPEGDAR